MRYPTKNEKVNINRIFTILLVSFPIISIYGIGISSITLGDALLFVVLIMCAIKSSIKRKKIAIAGFLLPYFLYIIINFLLIQLIEQGVNYLDILLRTSRYLVYLLTLIVFVKDYFDIELGYKVYKYIAIFSTVFLIVQYILLKSSNYYLSGYIKFLPILREDLLTFSDRIVLSSKPRVRSIFAEPSHYATYVLGFLGLSLFSRRGKYVILSIFLTLGIILSASATGILVAALLWFIWIFKINYKKIKIQYIMFFMITLFLMGLFLANSNQFTLFLNRMGEGTSVSGRFSGYSYVIQLMDQSILRTLIGYGMKDISQYLYLAGYARMIYYYGFLGTIIFIISMLKQYVSSKEIQKVMIIIILILNTGTIILLGRNILVYFPFIILGLPNVKITRDRI